MPKRSGRVSSLLNDPHVRGGLGRPAIQAAAIPIAGCRILRGRGPPGRI
jgi:hypothetical protein